MYIILNNGVKGLICAIELAKQGSKVTLIDERQEIGTPVHRPGLIRTKEVIKWLINFEFPLQLNLFSFSNNIDNWYGLRMEWFEKSLATIASSLGVEIILKTQITSLDEVDGKEYVCISNPSINNKSKIFGQMIDCTMNDDFSSISPIVKISKWYGGIANGHDMPFEWQKNGWKDEKLMIPRKDGTIECWTPNEKQFVEPNSGWLEIITNDLPMFPYTSLDYSISSGINLAAEIHNNI